MRQILTPAERSIRRHLRRWIQRTPLLALLAGAFQAVGTDPLAAQNQAPPAWDEPTYNPVAAEDDFLLPMPCGGKMAFRKVLTTTLGLGDGDPDFLNDRRALLGVSGSPRRSVEYPRYRFLQGAFTDRSRDERFYYLGKYEVTLDQWRAVMDDGCPQAGSYEGQKPANLISWYDAVRFTERYNSWLYANAADALPREGQAPTDEVPTQAFVRLPTEAEWEFAARGGVRVSTSDFRQPVYPIPEDERLVQHAWYQGPESAGGDLQPVGGLKPNPLGLFDILGNAEEFVLTPFNLNRAGREHGQIGGFVTKGGSVRTPQDGLRTTRRDEYNYMDPYTKSPRVLETFGLRIAISAPVQVDHERMAQIEQEWQALRAQEAEGDDGDPISTIERIAGRVSDPRDVADLKSAASVLTDQAREHRELARRFVEGFVYSAATTIRKLRDDERRLGRVRRAAELACTQCEDNGRYCDRCKNYSAAADDERRRLGITQDAYFNILTAVADDFPADRVFDALGAVRQRFEQTGLPSSYVAFAELFARQVEGYRQDRDLDTDKFIREILTLGEDE
jgi:hypothetical protein